MVSRIDLVFFVYYAQKAAHKLKAIFNDSQKIRLALNNFMDYSKGSEIFDKEDFTIWEALPQ